MSKKTDWRYGHAEANWMEGDLPSGNYFSYIVEVNFNKEETLKQDELFRVLSKLQIFHYGDFYEGWGQIRIRA